MELLVNRLAQPRLRARTKTTVAKLSSLAGCGPGGSHGTQLPPGRPQAVLARALIGITGPWDGHQILHK